MKTGTFTLDLRTAIAKAKEKAGQVIESTLVDLATQLVQRSPVGNPLLWQEKPPAGYVPGAFRGNWQHAFNVLPAGVLDVRDADGSATIAALTERIRLAMRSTTGNPGTQYGVHMFVNNLPYARRLEYGHSRQAPSGIVGLTAMSLQESVLRAAGQVK